MSTVLSREGRGSLGGRSHLDSSCPWGVGFLQGPKAGMPLCGGGYMGWTKRGTYCLPWTHPDLPHPIQRCCGRYRTVCLPGGSLGMEILVISERIWRKRLWFWGWEGMQGKVKILVAQSCPSLCDPMDCGSPGSSIHGILQARTLEWVSIPFTRGSSRPR